MGHCLGKEAKLQSCTRRKYLQEVHLAIQSRDVLGKVTAVEQVLVSLPRPVQVSAAREVRLDRLVLDVTTCVLPGFDPRGQVAKPCQDGLFWAVEKETLLVCLFDGHGDNGAAVKDFCQSFVKAYFTDNQRTFQEDAEMSLKQMMELCDAELNASSGIDVSLSGTTAVAAFLTGLNLTVGSLGDSRCILGAIDSDGSTLGEVGEIVAYQLSVDQKPHHQQELERIQRKGGKVAKLQNQYGAHIGPYRVWTKDNVLGLAMSRSIGDAVGHSVGVQATPITRRFQLQPGQDHFLVLASDGVW